jgi:broad specificity phosphatase PhoE
VEEGWHRVFAGSRVDMALSPLGHQQGAALAEWFGDRELDMVFASPMRRVQLTMAALLQRRSLKPSTLPGLREVDFGDWTGSRWEQVCERFGLNAVNWLHALEHPGIPNGDSAAGLLDRVRSCVDQILATPGISSAAVFCHGGIVRAILAVLLDLPFSKLGHLRVDYGSVTAVQVLPDDPRAAEIELLNFCPPGGLGVRR